jgi:hypothetical protein
MSTDNLAPQEYASFCSYAMRRCGTASAFVRYSMLRRHVAQVVEQLAI